MKRLIGFFILLFLVNTAFGQTGYFGNKNLVEIGYVGAPSFAYRTKFIGTANGINEFSTKQKIQSPSYTLRYERVFSDRYAAGAGYTYSSIKIRNSGYYDDQNSFTPVKIGDLVMNYHAVNLNFRVARGKSVCPTGKYFGAELSVGRGLMTENPVFPNLTFDPTTTLFVYATAGWTFPITDFLFLSLEGRLNALGLVFQSGSYQIAQFEFLNYAFDILSFEFPSSSSNPIYQDASNVNTISRGIFDYNYLAFKFGVHYAF